jgi:probable HAF family extracellular repeat protein
MKTKNILVISLPITVCLLSSMRLSAASFQGLGDLPGGSVFSAADAIAADGNVVVGYSSSSLSGASSYEAVRWTATNGMIGLGDLAGGTFSSFAFGVSADGSVIVGQGDSTNGTEAFRWTQATGMVGLGDLAGSSFFSVANGVSGNGQVVVGFGTSTLSGTRSEAFRWTMASGMVGLGDLPGGNFDSQAFGVSADGSFIVGKSSSSNGVPSEAFRWTTTNGMVGLGDLPGSQFNSIAYAVSAGGSVVVGRGFSSAYGTPEAFRWTAATGLVGLGHLACDTYSIAHAVSGDGLVIVGDSDTSSGDCAFIWDAQNGIRNLHQVLVTDYGLNLTGWQLYGARGVSSDGKIIVGYGINPSGKTEGWIANLAPPSLTVRREGSNSVLSWPTNVPGFTLQSATNLTPLVNWIDSTNAPTIVGAEFTVTNAVSNSSQLYRLKK